MEDGSKINLDFLGDDEYQITYLTICSRTLIS